MSDAQLSVSLSAEVVNFNTAMASAAAESNRTSQAVSTTAANITRNIAAINRVDLNAFNRALQSGRLSLQQLGAAGATVPAQLGRVSAGSDQAAQALMNMGRVAQDAPFGFMAIQNNLNPLLESFQRLRAETGSNALAFKALLSSLTGPAGLGVALSVAGAAILFIQMGFRAWTGTVKDAKKASDEYIDSLSQLAQANLKGAQAAQKDEVILKTLYDITQDLSMATSTRKKAVDELQKMYPEYFKNIKDEVILNGGAEDSYKKLAASILATARARASQDEIAKNSALILENENKINDAQKIREQLEAKRAKERSKAKSVLDLTFSLDSKLLAIYKEQSDAQIEINKLQTKNEILAENISKKVVDGADLFGKVGDSPKEKTLKSLSDILKELNEALVVNDNQFQQSFSENNVGKIAAYQSAIESLIANGFKPLSEEVLKLKVAQKNLFQLPELPTPPSANKELPAMRNKFGHVGLEIDFVKEKDPIKELSKAEEAIKKRLLELNKNLASAATDGIKDSLSGIGAAIGESLANGGNVIESVGQSLVSSLGSTLVELGKIAIAAGIGIEAIKSSFKTLNPAIAITAGAALIALGSAIKSRVSNLGGGGKSDNTSNSPRSIPQFAAGVQNFRGGMALVGERGPELVDLPTGASVIPNGRTERMINNSSSRGVTISTELGISMGVLVAKIRQEEKKLGRLG